MDEILSFKDVCSYLKLAKSTVYKLSQEGSLPSARVGRNLRFRKSRIDAWLDRQEMLKAKKAHLRKKKAGKNFK